MAETMLNQLVDNIAVNMSEELYSSGKTNAFVISHTGPSSSDNINGYQRGERVIYHNGEELYRTKEKGDLYKIAQNKINDKLNQ